jgi:RHS repeat-associated protein
MYNEANLLERVEVWLEQDTEPAGLLEPDTATQHAVKNIDYNAKGQREFIEYGNGVRTQYEYDPLTFRLTDLFTTRGTRFPADCSNPYPCTDPPHDCPKPRNFSCGLQSIHYTYDPAGNIIAIRDDAQQTIYFDGQVVRPDSEYKYDAIYRLIEATGREHIGQASIPHTTWNDQGRVNLAHPNDGQKMRRYFEFYGYDEVGNIKRFDHKAHSGNWIRAYDYNEASLIEPGKKSNRLSSTTVRGTIAHYKHDPHGNIEWMPHLEKHPDPNEHNMHWDFKDQLQMVDLKGGGTAYYVYDAAGQRVRKVVEKNNNGALIEERIYLGGFEVFRRSNDSGLKLERETLHIMDDRQRIALVETRTQGNDPAPEQLIRYQYGNHLGSASLELDHQAQIISYEEYYPYGSTSYQALRSLTETPKRYRYTGKERDEESGLYYHGARYYAPWLGRWTSADPAGMTDGTNLYLYTSNNPVGKRDPTGLNDQQCVMPLPWEEELGLSSESTDPNAPTALEESLQMSISSEHMPHMAETTPLEQQLQQSIPSEHDPQLDLPVSEMPRIQEEGWEIDVDSLSRTAGQGAVTTWDARQRTHYIRNIKASSARWGEGIRAARAAGDITAAESAAREASKFRNVERAATQRRLSPGGRLMSRALEQSRPEFSQLVDRYGGPGRFETYEEIVRAAGRSRPSMTAIARIGRVAGPCGLAVGVGVSGHAIYTAPPEERTRVVYEETGSFGGGALGGSAGAGVGVLAASGIATLLGLSGPPGWLVLGLGIVGGIGGGYLGSRGGRAVGRETYKASTELEVKATRVMQGYVRRMKMYRLGLGY